jgi:hypothetical protein
MLFKTRWLLVYSAGLFQETIQWKKEEWQKDKQYNDRKTNNTMTERQTIQWQNDKQYNDKKC